MENTCREVEEKNTVFRRAIRETGNKTKKKEVEFTDQDKTVCNIFENFGLDSDRLITEVGFGDYMKDYRYHLFQVITFFVLCIFIFSMLHITIFLHQHVHCCTVHRWHVQKMSLFRKIGK